MLLVKLVRGFDIDDKEMVIRQALAAMTPCRALELSRINDESAVMKIQPIWKRRLVRMGIQLHMMV